MNYVHSATTAPDARPGVNNKALWALVCAFPVAFVAVILGHVARGEIRRTGERGGAAALAAVVIGYAMCVLWTVFWTSLVLASAGAT